MLTATSCCSSDSPAAAAAPGAARPTRSTNAEAGAALAVTTAAAAVWGDDGGAGGRKGAGAHQRLGRVTNAYTNSFQAPPTVDGRGGLLGSARADEGWLLSLLLLLRLRLLLPSPWRGSVVGRLCACCRVLLVVGQRASRRKPAAAGEGTGAADGRSDSDRDDARSCTVDGAGRKAAAPSRDDGGAIGDGMTTARHTYGLGPCRRRSSCVHGFEKQGLGWTISRTSIDNDGSMDPSMHRLIDGHTKMLGLASARQRRNNASNDNRRRRERCPAASSLSLLETRRLAARWPLALALAAAAKTGM